MAFYSPLRYPGGKRRLSNYMKLILRLNGLMDGCYIEPYAGGSGVALSLLFSEYVSEVYINDISDSVYAFWYSVLNYTDELCALIDKTEISIDEWNRQKIIQHKDNVTILELGFSTFFLNRTNRSGILLGGVIGGIEQSGVYKIDARFNKDNLVQRIRRIARFKSRIHLYNRDAAVFIEDISPLLPEKALIYLDPPYYEKGKGLYEDYYEHKDHQNLSEIISELENNWIISYDNSPIIQDFYKGFRSISYGLSYSVSERYRGTEIMFFCNDLIIPEVESPSRINTSEFNRIMENQREG